jgi:zinc finger HIT domain-containing protein 1
VSIHTIMLNFGVQEIVISKTSSAPGWAYVPDTGTNPASLQPASRKRPRNVNALSQDTTAKQDAKLMRELAALDREHFKEITIPLPTRQRENNGRSKSTLSSLQSRTYASLGKTTPAVRKILQSAKTFTNHLSDFEAFLSGLNATSTSHATAAVAPATAILTSRNSIKGIRSHKKKSLIDSTGSSSPSHQISAVLTSDSVLGDLNSIKPVFGAGKSVIPPHLPGDHDPLLVSRIPHMPSAEELETLLNQPPLTYLDAKGPWTEQDRRKPIRKFCEVCGYWGRVKCKTCGGRVCALECLGVHQEDCFAKYGT